LHLGWRKLKIISFPLFTALFMFPPPSFLNNKLTLGLKLISSQIGVAMVQWYGMSAHREGNVIDLGFTQLQVADACSGLRFFFPLIIMGVLLAYFYKTGIWKGIILTISAIPLSVLMNSLRIALTGILYQYWGPKVAQDFFHGFSGWLVFMASFALLFGELWILRIATCNKTILTGENAAAISARPKVTADAPGSGSSPWFAFAKEPRFLASATILVLTLVIFQTIDFREKPPLRKPFSQFPAALGQWSGTRQFIGQDVVAELDLTDYVMMDYRNGSGEPVNFYVAYYQSQRKGESIHSPETCLPGGGWNFRQAGAMTIPLPHGNPITVKRAVMEKGGSRQLVYFWFPARGRALTNAYELKLYGFWDALTRQRTDAALVRVITPVLSGESVEKAEKRLQNMVLAAHPVLQEYIPN
jgi:exosortase D (VPLPA-CTERM-specific)